MSKHKVYGPSIADRLRAITDPQERAAEYLRIVTGTAASSGTLRKLRKIALKDAGVTLK